MAVRVRDALVRMSLRCFGQETTMRRIVMLKG